MVKADGIRKNKITDQQLSRSLPCVRGNEQLTPFPTTYIRSM
jgi:hypothetical protein